MKKTLVIAALFLATGIVSSCSKENSVKPTTTKTTGDMVLGTGDGRPTGGADNNSSSSTNSKN